MGVSNEAGIKNARRGRFKGGKKLFTFTHRNPKNGMVWCEDCPTYNAEGGVVLGKWISSDNVVFV